MTTSNIQHLELFIYKNIFLTKLAAGQFQKNVPPPRGGHHRGSFFQQYRDNCRPTHAPHSYTVL